MELICNLRVRDINSVLKSVKLGVFKAKALVSNQIGN